MISTFFTEFYEKFVALKKRGVKVLLAIGGWNDSAGNKYSKLVNNKQARDKFITHVIQFLKKYNFDGLDVDWEYPKCWQVCIYFSTEINVLLHSFFLHG